MADEIQVIADEITKVADNLNDEEFNFCEEYLSNLTSPVAVAVARALPYEENPHSRAKSLLNNPNIIKYLDLRRKLIRRAFITKDDVMLRLYNILDKCTQPVAVLDNKGHPTGEYQFDSRGATKILEMLAKHFNIIDNKEVTTDNAAGVVPNVLVDGEQLGKFLDDFNAQY